MSTMSCIGIDPGKDGYLCGTRPKNAGLEIRFWQPRILTVGGKSVYDVHGTAQEILEFLEDCDGSSEILIEKQQAFPKQGGVSNFTTGYGFGMYLGIVSTLSLCADSGRPVSLSVVRPTDWMKVELQGMKKDKNDRKAASIIRAKQLYPGVDLKRTPRCTTDHDGKAESLLIAHHLRHWMWKEPKPEFVEFV